MSPLNGGAERVRTDDLLNANQPLFQLSYGPIFIQQRFIINPYASLSYINELH